MEPKAIGVWKKITKSMVPFMEWLKGMDNNAITLLRNYGILRNPDSMLYLPNAWSFTIPFLIYTVLAGVVNLVEWHILKRQKRKLREADFLVGNDKHPGVLLPKFYQAITVMQQENVAKLQAAIRRRRGNESWCVTVRQGRLYIYDGADTKPAVVPKSNKPFLDGLTGSRLWTLVSWFAQSYWLVAFFNIFFRHTTSFIMPWWGFVAALGIMVVGASIFSIFARRSHNVWHKTKASSSTQEIDQKLQGHKLRGQAHVMALTRAQIVSDTMSLEAEEQVTEVSYDEVNHQQYRPATLGKARYNELLQTYNNKTLKGKLVWLFYLIATALSSFIGVYLGLLANLLPLADFLAMTSKAFIGIGSGAFLFVTFGVAIALAAIGVYEAVTSLRKQWQQNLVQLQSKAPIVDKVEQCANRIGALMAILEEQVPLLKPEEQDEYGIPKVNYAAIDSIGQHPWGKGWLVFKVFIWQASGGILFIRFLLAPGSIVSILTALVNSGLLAGLKAIAFFAVPFPYFTAVAVAFGVLWGIFKVVEALRKDRDTAEFKYYEHIEERLALLDAQEENLQLKVNKLAARVPAGAAREKGKEPVRECVVDPAPAPSL